MAFLQDHALQSWDDARVFLAAAREKTLGAAGRRLGLDTSTVSRRVSAFEERLGLHLFERSRDGLLLTHAGAQLLPAAEAMEAAHARLTRDASGVEAEPEGVVRLTTSVGVADHVVAPLVAELRAKLPGIRLQIEASARTLDLKRHEADLALRSVEPVGAELLIKRVGAARWVPAAAPELAALVGTLGALEDVDWIHWDEADRFDSAMWLRRHASRARIVLQTSQFSSQIAAARAGAGVVLTPTAFLEDAGLEALRLHRRLKAAYADLPIDRLWLVCHRALRDVPRIAAVWNFFAEQLAKRFPAP